MIVTHTHTTETVPVMNCGEGYVFARVGDRAWKCITEQRYEEIERHDTQVTINALIIAVMITALLFITIWCFNRD